MLKQGINQYEFDATNGGKFFIDTSDEIEWWVSVQKHGTIFTDLIAIYDPKSENFCLHIPKPLGQSLVKDVIYAVNELNCRGEF